MHMQITQVLREDRSIANISIADRLLWWLAAVEPGLVYLYPVEANRFRIVGLIVGSTGLFAMLAWMYFFSTTSTPVWALVPLGGFMGLVVINIDRALIKTMNPLKKQWFHLLLRMILALVLGLFMAQPAVLFLFDEEVKTQISIDNGERIQQKRLQLDSMYAGQRKSVQQQLLQLETIDQTRYTALLQAQQAYLAEADGTGGSGTKGISLIAKAKQQAYAERNAAYQQWQAEHKPTIDSLQKEMANIETNIRKEEAAFTRLLNHGFLTRIVAMQHLIAQNTAVAFRYYLIMALLMLIELMPVIVKSLMPAGPYAVAVQASEEWYKEQLLEDWAAKKAAAKHDRQLRQATEAATLADMHRHFSLLAKEEIAQAAAVWQSNKEESAGKFWHALFRRLLR